MKGLWRSLRGWLLAAGIAAAAYALLHWVVLRPAPVKVRVRAAERGVVELTVSNTKAGSVRSRLDAEIAAESSGRVVQVVRREGAEVSKGDPLVLLDDRTASAALALAQKDLAAAAALQEQAQASADEAVRELRRVQGLRAEGAVSQSEVDRAKSQADISAAALKAAEARADQARAAERQAQIEVDKLTTRAPFDGVITDLHIEVGEWAVPGKPLLRLVDPRNLYIRAEIDEVDMGQIREGLKARVRLDPYRERTFAGNVTKIARHVSELLAENRTVEIEVELQGDVDGAALKPGMSADVEIVVDTTKPDAVRIPTLALIDGRRVLLAEGGMSRSADVQLGLRNWDFTEIRKGLSVGERVIVSLDRAEVKEGVRIQVEEPGAR